MSYIYTAFFSPVPGKRMQYSDDTAPYLVKAPMHSMCLMETQGGMYALNVPTLGTHLSLKVYIVNVDLK